jgi:SAM-dependent methyltransferase
VSVRYYDQNAEAYFAATVAADVHSLRSKFLIHIPDAGDIFDAGCGSGRDALAFQRAGYDVTSFDASLEMCRVARLHTKLPVIQMTFREMMWDCAFDGIWACASLLHVPRVELPEVLLRFVRALRPGGVLYASFKYGTKERMVDGRWFTDMTEPALRSLFRSIGLNTVECWITNDVRTGRTEERWLNALAIWRHA